VILQRAGRWQDEELASEMIRRGLCRTLGEATVDRRRKIQVLDRFHEISARTQRGGFTNLFGIVQSRAHDDLGVGPELAQSPQSFEAIHSGHLQVEQHHIGGAPTAQALQRLIAAVGRLDVVRVELQQDAKVALDFGGVVHDEDGGYERITCDVSHRGNKITCLHIAYGWRPTALTPDKIRGSGNLVPSEQSRAGWVERILSFGTKKCPTLNQDFRLDA